MTTVSDVLTWLDERFPPSWAQAWDNVGLQVGDPAAVVERIVVALDPTAAVIEDATGACLVTHHPLIFEPIASLDVRGDPTGAALLAAIDGGVAVLAAHTNADVAEGGVADVLADRLGVAPERSALDGADPGTGRVGFLEDPCSAGELLERVRTTLGGVPLLIGSPSREVRTLAVCGGSGAGYVADAAACGADAFVTGDVKHHAALDALARDLPVIDAGHHPTEFPWVESLAPQLAAAFPTADVRVSQVATNPFAEVA